MKYIHSALHKARTPKAKQLIKKFKEEFAEEISWDKLKGKYRK